MNTYGLVALTSFPFLVQISFISFLHVVGLLVSLDLLANLPWNSILWCQLTMESETWSPPFAPYLFFVLSSLKNLHMLGGCIISPCLRKFGSTNDKFGIIHRDPNQCEGNPHLKSMNNLRYDDFSTSQGNYGSHHL